MRAYRALLRLFPASFRVEYGDEMAAVFRRRLRDASGTPARALVWADALRDLTWNAARVHADVLRQDLRFARRSLGRTPAFTAAAVLVTSLGIGATTSTFSVADHVLLRPLPFADAGRLVMLWQDQSARGYARTELSPANYRDWKAMATSFEAMGAYGMRSVNLVGRGDPVRLDAARITADVFPLLGAQAALGRTFAPSDDLAGATPTVVLGHPLWQERFGSDAGVLGGTIVLDDVAHVVIGVMPAGFRFPGRGTQAWTALRLDPGAFEDRTDTHLYVVAKLRLGVPLEQARAEMREVAGRLERAYPEENAKTSATVYPLRDHLPRQSRLLVAALFGGGACVLLIACANLAGLLLARGLHRRREVAVRTVLGAGRDRLVRQMLTESLVLAAAGGALGVVLAALATPLVARLVPTGLPIAALPPMDLRVLAFACVLTVATGILFGVVPALRAARGPDADALREGPRIGTVAGRERLRSALVMAEVGLSVVLLVSAGLLLRSAWRVQEVDPGFRTEGVLTMRTTLPLPKYERTADRQRFYDEVLGAVRGLPGVSQAGYTSFLPMVMRGGIWAVKVEGRPSTPGEDPLASMRYVTPGLLEALGVPMRRGRGILATDTSEAPPVAVVSESFARQFLPGHDPLGQRFTLAFQARTVVGVVADIRVRGLESPSEPQVYLPSTQVPDGAIIFYAPKDLAIRATGPLEALVPAVRRIVATADPQQPVADVRTMEDVVAAETAPRLAQVRVLGAFALGALLLAGVGLHGLLAFTVATRAREIGVRVALGAATAEIAFLVFRHGARLALAGTVAGIALAAAAGRLLHALLAGLSPYDPVAMLAAAGLALAVTLLGTLAPAVRAARVDPSITLRAE